MKIFFVLHGFPPELSGGTERTVEALAVAMGQAGHLVTVVCGSLEVAPTGQVDEFEHAGLRVLRLHRDDLYFEHWSKCYHPGVAETLMELFVRERPDVVHVHHWLRLTSDIARLARAVGAKTVITAHDYFTVLGRIVRRCGDDAVEPPPVERWVTAIEASEEFELLRWEFADELRAAQLLLAPSQAHADGIRALWPDGLRPDDRGVFSEVGECPAIEVTPTPLLQLPARLSKPPQPGGKRLVTWGSIYPDKGLETVLDAMRAAGGEWSLQVLGEAHDEAYKTEIQNFAAGLTVSFTGAFETRDLAALTADYAVLPTLCLESYGLVVDEAQALGLPVIASDVPAYRERLQSGSTVFFPPGDAASLTMMLLDPEALARLQPPAAPVVMDATAAADDLLVRYEGLEARLWSPNPRLARRRARALFRRAERRLWSALNGGELRLPPDDFLRSS